MSYRNLCDYHMLLFVCRAWSVATISNTARTRSRPRTLNEESTDAMQLNSTWGDLIGERILNTQSA